MPSTVSSRGGTRRRPPRRRPGRRPGGASSEGEGRRRGAASPNGTRRAFPTSPRRSTQRGRRSQSRGDPHWPGQPEVRRHRRDGGLRRVDDPWQPRARMGAGADDVQPGDLRVAVVGAEVGALGQARRDRERRALEGVSWSRKSTGVNKRWTDDLPAAAPAAASPGPPGCARRTRARCAPSRAGPRRDGAPAPARRRTRSPAAPGWDRSRSAGAGRG